MKREIYHMIDIETTGTNKETDDILEIAIVKIQRDESSGFWGLCLGQDFHRKVFSSRQPENKFAKENMSKLYDECNKLNPERDDIGSVSEHLRVWLHGEENYGKAHQDPKYFMGWNASNFDLEFMFKKGVMSPTYYIYCEDKKKEVLYGDAHYRVYEQTGAIEFLIDVTGFSRNTIMKMAEDMIPPQYKLSLPEGKLHDALYDCYSQINMMNGLIALGKKGFKAYA